MKPSAESKLKMRIGDRDFELSFIDSKDSLKTTSASAAGWHQRIVICSDDRKTDGLMSDLWHEVAEMINDTYSLNLNHQTIATFGSAIHQVLRDNSEILLAIAKKGERL